MLTHMAVLKQKLLYWSIHRERLTFFRSQISRLHLFRSARWCNLNFLPFLIFCPYFLPIFSAYSRMFIHVLAVFSKLRSHSISLRMLKPNYDSIIKTKGFITNAMGLILMQPLPKLRGLLQHILLDWKWWSYAGAKIKVITFWLLSREPGIWPGQYSYPVKVLANGGSKRLKGRLWSALLCYPHVLTKSPI